MANIYLINLEMRTKFITTKTAIELCFYENSLSMNIGLSNCFMEL